MKNDKPILVAGATGYVGRRLIPALLDAGYRVRAMGRSVEKLACRPWGHHPKVEWVKCFMGLPGLLKNPLYPVPSVLHQDFTTRVHSRRNHRFGKGPGPKEQVFHNKMNLNTLDKYDR